MRLKYIFLWISLMLVGLVGVILWREGTGSMTSLLFCEGCLAVIILFLWIFYRNVVKPAKILKQASGLMSGMDFSSHVRTTGQPDMDEVIGVFNKMLMHLSEQRLRVREINEMLDIMISVMPTGVIITESNGCLVHVNPSAAKFLEIENPRCYKGHNLLEIRHRLAAMLKDMEEGKVTVVRINGTKLYRCFSYRFFNMGVPHIFYIIEEMTKDIMEVQRRSYRKVLRVISHEVNNTMAGLNATLEILEQDLADTLDNDMQQSIASLLRRNRAVVKFISSLADTARIPEPERKSFNLLPLLSDLTSQMQVIWSESGVAFEMDDYVPGDSLMLNADMSQIQQVLLNVMKNAAESVEGDGVVRIEPDLANMRLTISDNGRPITREVADQLFTPFFTTKPNGQGIGLMMVGEILDNHGYGYSLATSDTDGITRFTIAFAQ